MRILVSIALAACAANTATPSVVPVAREAPPIHTVDPILAWHRAAFTYAGIVARVRVVGAQDADTYKVETVEAIRGPVVRTFSLGARETLAPGSEWLVAGDTGGHPSVVASIAVVPASERAQLASWIEAPASWARYLGVVEIVAIAPNMRNGGETLNLRVARSLRGDLPAALYMSVPARAELFAPWKPGPAQYLMSALSVKDSHVTVHDLVAYDGEAVPAPTKRAATDDVGEAWATWRAPVVASTTVRVSEETSGCGGTHYRLALLEVVRGDVDPARLADGELFWGGGHCRHHAFDVAAKHLAAGEVGGTPSVLVDDTPANRKRLARWSDAPPPRLAALPVDDAAFTATTAPRSQPSPVFEPDVDLRALLALRGRVGAWTQFEVIRVHRVGRYAWMHLRAIPSRTGYHAGTGDWMFAGPDLPAWPVGSRWLGFSIGWRTPESSPRLDLAGEHLFLAGGFLPADIDLRRLLHVTGNLRE